MENWEKAEIRVLLKGREIASVSFFDEAIGLLIKKGGKEISEITSKLKFPDIAPTDRLLLNDVVRMRVNENKLAKNKKV